MRWQTQELTFDDVGALPGMARLSGLVRSIQSPEFAGVTFHEVHAKSALNRVPGGGPMPFSWTINPYRGCTHACTYCFARRTHEYLEWDSGRDFDTQIVVKTNVAQVLGREVMAPRWQRESVALGTNTDPYQRAEGRYALMPGVLAALADSGTPFSVLTKGTVLARDLPLIAELAEKVPVGLGISLAMLDRELHDTVEPGTPTPAARLGLIRKITELGLGCGVLIAPILPHLTDSTDALRELVGHLVQAGATGVTGIVLHLRPGAREWFLAWLTRTRPDLVPAYEQLYRRGANADPDYRRLIGRRVAAVKAEFGLVDERFREVGAGVPGAEGALFPAGSLPVVASAAGSVDPHGPPRLF